MKLYSPDITKPTEVNYYWHEKVLVEPMPGWVPCSERMPEANKQDKQGFYKAYLVQRGSRTYTARWDGTHWVLWTVGTVLEGVVAWMPLPEPWKGIGNDKDTIYRADAIKAVDEAFDLGDCYCDRYGIRGAIQCIPSAENKGEWILECDAEGEDDNLYRCSECGCNYGCQEYDIPNYCPNCGVRMKGVEMSKDITSFSMYEIISPKFTEEQIKIDETKRIYNYGIPEQSHKLTVDESGIVKFSEKEADDE